MTVDFKASQPQASLSRPVARPIFSEAEMSDSDDDDLPFRQEDHRPFEVDN
jgi:hypothetical protein